MLISIVITCFYVIYVCLRMLIILEEFYLTSLHYLTRTRGEVLRIADVEYLLLVYLRVLVVPQFLTRCPSSTRGVCWRESSR